MLDEIRAHNKELLQWFRSEQNQHAVRRQALIQDILSSEACFFTMTLEEAFAVLRDLEIPHDQLLTTYVALTNPRVYSKLHKQL